MARGKFILVSYFMGLTRSTVVTILFFVFEMQHEWQSSHQRFIVSDNNPTKYLALISKGLRKMSKQLKTT